VLQLPVESQHPAHEGSHAPGGGEVVLPGPLELPLPE
jgi:hypothetical protein